MAIRAGTALMLLCAALCVPARAASDYVFSNGFDPVSDAPPNRAEASRFLAQATFGASEADLDALVASGYRAWLDRQMQLPPRYALPHMRRAEGVSDPLHALPFWRFSEAWFVNVLGGDDQLRQRVAFALSEIFVVSERGNALGNDGLALGAYYDILLRNAFGNYRQLLEDVTLSPAMGRYLSMYRNRKPDPANNIQSDENYAREVMQLFSIGLVKLNRDGTPVLVGGETVPTYDGDVVRAFARVFTGWACHCGQGQQCPSDPFEQENFTCSTEHEMVPFEAYHDRGEKRLLDGAVLPAGRDARPELEAALDVLFNHPNVAPFIGRQLIQRLVTSNPSPTYVGRVAAAFENNGAGVRGDLGATIRAVLLDPEARSGHRTSPATFGKVREPLLRLTQMWRAFDVMWKDDELFPDDRDIQDIYNQAALLSPSVFNFFAPDHVPAGPLATASMVAPEMQVITANFAIHMTNDLAGRIYWGYRGGPMDEFDSRVRLIQLERWEQLIRPLPGEPEAPAGALDALVDRCNDLLLGGQMSTPLRQRLHQRLLAIPATDTLRRVQNVLYLITTSAEYAVQR
ncbi:MAG: DUF1800 domain-containing protein [Rhodanobacteraceae bacterium]|jgi:uncharacterized protein (DUF1800 family)|nr:DUF1800 domain-containing protein [Rhodanobacteraceae bacterium]